MNRIEEIRARVKEADEKGTSSDEWQELETEAYRDITYLLAKLEQAEKALEVAHKHIEGTAEKFSERERTPVLFRINEALSAIRS